MIAGTTEYFHKIQYNGNSVVFRCIVFYFNGFAFFWDTLYYYYTYMQISTTKHEYKNLNVNYLHLGGRSNVKIAKKTLAFSKMN